MKNQRKWIVVDGENNIAWDTKRECGRTFATYESARKAAHVIATCEPGTDILVCETKAIVCADVKPAQARKA